jgi:hypothetical protein
MFCIRCNFGWLLAFLLICSGLGPVQAAAQANGRSDGDLYYAEALFYAFQEDYFDAIVRLDTELAQHYQLDEPQLDSLYQYKKNAEFSIGDLELNYRMHQRAGRAIQRVLDAQNVPLPVRNEAAYRLAKMYFAKGYHVNAMHALDLIQDPVPAHIQHEVIMLKAQLEMTQRNYPKAVQLLRPIRNSEQVGGYAGFNLGIALMQAGDFKKGSAELSEVGVMPAGERDREMLALRDKANLTLGNRLLEEGQPGPAREFLERVRLRGPLSNKALLWAGWADMARKEYQRALVPWTELHRRDPTDAAVQEALLALPYAYAQLEAFGRAALLYGEAVNEFDKEIARLDTSIASTLNGGLRTALQKDPDERNSIFIQNLRSQPEAPETRYLLDLMASHDFQESVKNYRDMVNLKSNLENWLANIDAYTDLIEQRRTYYSPLLPGIEARFKAQDALMESALLRRDEVARRLASAQRRRDPQSLATQQELAVQRKLEQLQYQADRLREQPGLQETKARLRRLQGALRWQIDTEYDSRLALTHTHLKELDALITELRAQHQRIVRYKREAYQSYEGYETPFRRMATQLNGLLSRVQAVMLQQAQYLEKIAVKELERRKRKLADYRIKARFALAESYDRASKKQAEEAEAILRQQQNIKEIEINDAQPLESAPTVESAPATPLAPAVESPPAAPVPEQTP